MSDNAWWSRGDGLGIGFVGHGRLCDSGVGAGQQSLMSGGGQRLERCRTTVSDVAVSGGHNISKLKSIVLADQKGGGRPCLIR
jgi:hypothetical protein